MNAKLLAVMLLAGGSLFAESDWSISFGVGGYDPGYYYAAPPAPYTAVITPCPGPDYIWVDGCWYPYDGQYVWNAGYWAKRPFRDSYWVAPRYVEHRYYRGYWARGRNYDWDDDSYRSPEWDRDRDWDRGRDYGRSYGGGYGRDYGRENGYGNRYEGRQGFSRAFDQNRNAGFDQNRNRNFGENGGQNRGYGQNQDRNRDRDGDRGRGQERGRENGHGRDRDD